MMYFKQNDDGRWEVWTTRKIVEFPTMLEAIKFIEDFKAVP